MGRPLDSRQVAGRLRTIETPMAIFRLRQSGKYLAMYRNTVACERELREPSGDMDYVRTFEPGEWQTIDLMEAIENG